MSTAVMLSEERSIAELEVIIERGKQTFVEVGQALLEIRDRHLYRDTHATFEDYCKERWGFSRIAAHRYMAAVGVVDNLLPQGNIPSLTQARELAVLSPEQQREVAASTDFARTTVRELKERVDAVRGIMSIPKSGIPAPRWHTMPLYEAACAAVEAFNARDALGEPEDIQDYVAQYDAMAAAVKSAAAVDELKSIQDCLRAIKNNEFLGALVAIRMRAARRCGELITEGQAEGRLAGEAGEIPRESPEKSPQFSQGTDCVGRRETPGIKAELGQ